MLAIRGGGTSGWFVVSSRPLMARAVRGCKTIAVTFLGMPPTSTDWSRLMRLVHKALPQVKQTLLDATAPVLLVNSGLIARYEIGRAHV